MKNKNRLLGIMLVAGLILWGGAIGCGTVCDDAADICGTGGEGEVVEGDCDGAAECTAQCIVDADSCDISDPDLADCITGCAGG